MILGELFAKCPVDGYPGVAVEQVLDSSRYFVLRLQDDGGKIFYFVLNNAIATDVWFNKISIYWLVCCFRTCGICWPRIC